MEQFHELADIADRERGSRMCERLMLHPERCPCEETLPSRLQKVQPVPVLRGSPNLQEPEREHIRG